MNAQVTSIDEAREGTLPPIDERPARSYEQAPPRKKAGTGKLVLLLLGMLSVGFAGYAMIQGRLAQGAFGFGAEQDAAAKPDPMQLLQDRVASLESSLTSIGNAATQLNDAVANDLATMRASIGAVATIEDLAALRGQVDQAQATAASFSGRLASLENTEKQRRLAVLERAQQQQQQETRAREEEVTLPFRVLALDRWGGKTYATIAPPGVNVLETMGVGDKRAGWELAEVDARSGSLIFVDSAGRRVTKTVEER